MQQALLVRLRPAGPWRFGPSDGALDRLDTLYRSDRLFSAVTLAMRQLGQLEPWLDATARAEKPAVAFSSLFPFQGDTLFVVPPANLWPPPSSLVTSPSPVFLNKVRWRAAYFVPLSLVDALLSGQAILADQWIPNPESGCLLRRDRPSSSPFRITARSFAPVDRLSLNSAEAEASACVEFEPGSGLWTVARFADTAANENWSERLNSALRLLGDTGFGGGRSRGWGQVQAPEFESGAWPSLILPKVGRLAKNDGHEDQTSRSYWMLSLYSPARQDAINWSGGQYELAVRNGRVEGGTGTLKKSARMLIEGSVLDSAAEPLGAAVDVAPAGFPHPVYRSGIALALLIPPPRPQTEDRRAIEEIVPPELEATPFPMPAPEIREPEIGSAEEPAAEPATESKEQEVRSEIGRLETADVPASEAVIEQESVSEGTEIHEPEPDIEPFPEDPPEEPEPTPPVREPDEPSPVREPEPQPTPEHTPVQEPESSTEMEPENPAPSEPARQIPAEDSKETGDEL